MPGTPSAPEWTVQLWQYSWEERLTITAIAAWLAWDLLISLSDEVTYLWKGPGTWIKALYIFIRYVPIINQGLDHLRFPASGSSSTSTCEAWMAWLIAFQELLALAVEVILVIRVCALYKFNKILYRLIPAMFVVEIALKVALAAAVFSGETYSPRCLFYGTRRLFVGYWLTSLLFETFLFGLTLVKFLQSGIGISNPEQRRTFMYIFMRDGTWAFSLIFVAMLASTLVYQLSSSPRAGIGYSVLIGVLSFSGSHVILNIRRLSAPTTTQQTNTGTLVFTNPSSYDSADV